MKSLNAWPLAAAPPNTPPLRNPSWDEIFLILILILIGSLPPPRNLPRQMLVYHLVPIGKFMRGRAGEAGVGGRAQLDSPLLHYGKPSPPIHLPTKSNAIYTSLAASVWGRGDQA